MSLDRKYNLGNYQSLGITVGITRLLGDEFRGAISKQETISEACENIFSVLSREIFDIAWSKGIHDKVLNLTDPGVDHVTSPKKEDISLPPYPKNSPESNAIL